MCCNRYCKLIMILYMRNNGEILQVQVERFILFHDKILISLYYTDFIFQINYFQFFYINKHYCTNLSLQVLSVNIINDLIKIRQSQQLVELDVSIVIFQSSQIYLKIPKYMAKYQFIYIKHIYIVINLMMYVLIRFIFNHDCSC